MIWKCAALAVSAVIFGLAVRKEQEEQMLLLGLCAAVLITSAALLSLRDTEAIIRRAAERSGLSAALMIPVLKSLGIALLSRFVSAFCRDAGQASAAAALELAAACAILCVSAPLLESLLEFVFT